MSEFVKRLSRMIEGGESHEFESLHDAMNLGELGQVDDWRSQTLIRYGYLMAKEEMEEQFLLTLTADEYEAYLQHRREVNAKNQKKATETRTERLRAMRIYDQNRRAEHDNMKAGFNVSEDDIEQAAKYGEF